MKSNGFHEFLRNDGRNAGTNFKHNICGNNVVVIRLDRKQNLGP